MIGAASGDRLLSAASAWLLAIDAEPARRASILETLRNPRGGAPDFSLRPAAPVDRLRDWERRHAVELPASLRAWLAISDGFDGPGPPIHPLRAIGPMVAFARVPHLLIQPESWFELGNPGPETVCIDLGYRWPGGDCPVFSSGDDLRGSPPRLIATGFAEWFLRLLECGGRPFWFDREFRDLGSPWEAHRRHVPPPGLPERLERLLPDLSGLLRMRADDRTIARRLGIGLLELEELFRHVQHSPTFRGVA